MNMRNRNARNASRASSDFFSYLFFKDRSFDRKGMISNLQNNGFTVLIFDFGFEGFIEYSKEDALKNASNPKKLFSCIYENRELKIFDWVDVNIKVTIKNYRKTVHLTIL